MSWLFEIDTLENWAYIENFFNADECQKIINIANTKQKKEAEIISEVKLDLNVRNNKIVWLNPNDDIIWAYQKLSSAIINLNDNFFKFDLNGFTEDLQFTEYNAPNNKYVKHIDRGINIPVRKLSIVVQLTDPKKYKGGDLKLHYQNDPVIANKNQGTLIAFPSYTLHEVTPITKGTRHSLVAWIGGKSFK